MINYIFKSYLLVWPLSTNSFWATNLASSSTCVPEPARLSPPISVKLCRPLTNHRPDPWHLQMFTKTMESNRHQGIIWILKKWNIFKTSITYVLNMMIVFSGEIFFVVLFAMMIIFLFLAHQKTVLWQHDSQYHRAVSNQKSCF